MAPSFVHDALEFCLQRRGSDAVFMLLETIARCHILKVDCSADSTVCKPFIDKYHTKHSNLVQAMSDRVLSRDDILRRRVAPGDGDLGFSVAMSKIIDRIESDEHMVQSFENSRIMKIRCPKAKEVSEVKKAEERKNTTPRRKA